MDMSRLTRDGTAEPVSRDQILRHARGQINFPCSADHEQDWQPYRVDPDSLLYVLMTMCDPGWYVHEPDVQNKWDDNALTHIYSYTHI